MGGGALCVNQNKGIGGGEGGTCLIELKTAIELYPLADECHHGKIPLNSGSSCSFLGGAQYSIVVLINLF